MLEQTPSQDTTASINPPTQQGEFYVCLAATSLLVALCFVFDIGDWLFKIIGAPPSPLSNAFVGLLIILFSMTIYGYRRFLNIQTLEGRVSNLSFYDPVTQLPNRAMAKDRLIQMIALAKRRQTMVGALSVDVDNFKVVNDTYGHDAGDQIIREVAARVKDQLRTEDTIARFSGNAFFVMLEHISDSEQIMLVANRLLSAHEKPYVINGQDVFLSVSIGMSVYPLDAQTQEELIKTADVAMYQAKALGKNQYCFFSDDMKKMIAHRYYIESGLRTAIEREEFFLCYQPQINCADGEIIGYEALARWKHNGKIIPPDVFIPVAEETGLIVDIGIVVLRSACILATHYDNVRIAVNVAPRQLLKDEFVGDVERILAQTGLPAERLELEVTESALIKDIDGTKEKLCALQNLGVSIAIDDFGTGYSSLARLHEFKIDRLKIDRSFIRNIENDVNSTSVIATIISLANSMGMETIAEGIETKAQGLLLKELGADSLQGFYYSRPITDDKIAAFLETHHERIPNLGLCDETDEALEE